MAYRIYPLGDQALTLDWGNQIDEAVNRQVLAVWEQARQLRLPGVRNLIPAYSSLTIVFDAGELLRLFPGQPPFRVIREKLETILEVPVATKEVAGRLVHIPVCYDPALGPDLERLAKQHKLSMETVIQLHTTLEYRVYMIGFLPGFPYLGTVDERIATPRLSTPRVKVPAGSVGIAGAQTGIYPLQSPGGWNLIGRTPLRLFDPGADSPTLLQPGDRVRFFPVSGEEFHQMKAEL